LAALYCWLWETKKADGRQNASIHKEIHHEKNSDISGIIYDFVITCSFIVLSDFSGRTRAGTGTWTRAKPYPRTEAHASTSVTEVYPIRENNVDLTFGHRICIK